MIKLPKISTSQLLIMLVVSRMFSMFTYKPANTSVSALGVLLALAVSALFDILIFVPPYLILKKSNGNGISDSIGASLSPVSALFFFVTLIICLFLSLGCITQFEMFMATTIYLTVSPLFFMIPMLLSAVYICRLGIEAMSRFSGFIFLTLVFSVIVIGISVSPKINFDFFSSFQKNDINGFLYIVRENTAYTTEVIPFMFLSEYTRKTSFKSIVAFSVISKIILAFITVVPILTLGKYSETLMFPFYTLATMAKSVFSDRLDSFFIILWVFIAVIKLCVYLFTSAKCLRRLFVFKNDTLPLVICALSVFLAGILSRKSLFTVNKMYSVIVSGIPIILSAIIFPIISLIVDKIKEKTGK